MKEPPWIQLAELRRTAGLTQREAAAGIVSQSMICQIEKGRIMPSVDTLRAFAMRYDVEPDALVGEWHEWRMRGHIRDLLWATATEASSEMTLRGLLREYGQLLVPFEQHIYAALGSALEGDVARAEADVQMAWSVGGLASVNLKRRGPAKRIQDTHATAWTKVAKGRALVVEAIVHAKVCHQTGRRFAAAYWEQRVEARMKDTVWPGETSLKDRSNVVQ